MTFLKALSSPREENVHRYLTTSVRSKVEQNQLVAEIG
jgi:hypothetical protein